MASTIPSQERVVDPFASYNSNVVNRITEIVTHNTEGMLTVNSMQVDLDSTSSTNTVIVQPGYAVKDDVLIKITAEHTVDFTDPDNWVTPPMLVPAGNCYVVLEYQYLKQRPAPQANIKILQPTERGLIGGNSVYILLKVVTIAGPTLTITALNDYDTEVGYEDNARPYIKYYAGGEVNLPTFEQVRDQGRIAYESDRNKFYFGYQSEWGELAAGGVSIDLDTDSTSVNVGQLCYVNNSRAAELAISTDLLTSADVVVTAIGTAASGIGRGTTAGFVTQVPVEAGTGVGIATGDILYLSATTAGAVTNVRPDTFYQVVGRALSAGNATIPIEMIFSPKLMLSLSTTGQVSTWAGPDGTGYYNDIDVSALDGTSAFDCHWFDDATDREIRPTEVEIRSTGNVIRVYFDVNTLTVNYIIQSAASAGGSGGGGGGGASDHASLLNLGYGASGHTGFAPSPHGNADHSSVFITAAGVTYTNLNANGSVGVGASQVSRGTHTHQAGDTNNYNDVPSGSIILFEADTAVVGYSLLTDQDDMVVYITKGSAAGGETGGQLKSGGTWSQPLHNHSISSTGTTHAHTTGSHTLTISEMPSHNHQVTTYAGISGGIRINSATLPTGGGPGTTYTGGGASHNHGATGSDGSHDHGGTTGTGSTVNTWRPRGRNLTRQQKI